MKRSSSQGPEGHRKAYQAWVEGRGDADRSSCPDPDVLLDLVQGRMEEEARLTVLDHVMQCSGCRREFDLLRALEEAAPARSWRVPPWMAMAASVVLLLGVGYVSWDRFGPGARPVYRGGGDAITLLSPAPGENDGSVLTFAWSSRPGTAVYLLEILDEDGDVLLSRSTPDTTLDLPVREHPELSGSLSWWVRARGQDGVERGSAVRPLRLPSR